ncbi:hypothetical protein BV898_10569 [Hypsibius exemplaris]|uniref:RIIa domain-containing protein n=1 Tax=Hypsibius exemplaris TaxID=2072580 RepID=A0A1W0WIZ8_HYPEX|nr:hypothetical protein BV898_10569 [Hypsibius exemplaris]
MPSDDEASRAQNGEVNADIPSAVDADGCAPFTDDDDPPLTHASSNTDASSAETDSTDASSVETDSTDQTGAADYAWTEESQDTFNASFFPPPRTDLSEGPVTLPAPNPKLPSAESFPEEFDEDIPVAPEEIAHAIAFRDRILKDWKRTERSSSSMPLTVSEANMMSGADYLDATVGPLLAQGLAEILKSRPKNPAEFLAAYLLADQVRIDVKLEPPATGLTKPPVIAVPGLSEEQDSDSDLLSTPKDKSLDLSETAPGDIPNRIKALASSLALTAAPLKGAKSAASVA